jgi:hypothetical protein
VRIDSFDTIKSPAFYPYAVPDEVDLSPDSGWKNKRCAVEKPILREDFHRAAIDKDAQLQEVILNAKGCSERSRKVGMKIDFSGMRPVNANLVAFLVIYDLH